MAVQVARSTLSFRSAEGRSSPLQGWLRRATAELRLDKIREAVASGGGSAPNLGGGGFREELDH